jgi:hypothetical protein
MAIPEEQLKELATLFPGVAAAEEGGDTFYLIPSLRLPQGTSPEVVDALLCPTRRDGYESRLYFSEHIRCPNTLNWTVNGVHMLGRNWWAISWRTAPGLRLAQMVRAHLDAFRSKAVAS